VVFGEKKKKNDYLTSFLWANFGWGNNFKIGIKKIKILS